jgi:hypothetical protein
MTAFHWFVPLLVLLTASCDKVVLYKKSLVDCRDLTDCAIDGQQCVGGQCVCGANTYLCGSACVAEGTCCPDDPDHGCAQGLSCSAPGGQCGCLPGQGNCSCSGSCAGKACGMDDGCGTKCAAGSGCTCTPSCAGKTCGADDGCGTKCAAGSGCTCTPSCAGKICGADDGCGTKCAAGSGCTCTPSCAGKICGADDGCGTACNATTGSPGCCTPNNNACNGKNCGSVTNNCGQAISCGACYGQSTCGGGGTPNVCCSDDNLTLSRKYIDLAAYSQYQYHTVWCTLPSYPLCVSGYYIYAQENSSIAPSCITTGSTGSCLDGDAWWYVHCVNLLQCQYDCSGTCQPTSC